MEFLCDYYNISPTVHQDLPSYVQVLLHNENYFTTPVSESFHQEVLLAHEPSSEAIDTIDNVFFHYLSSPKNLLYHEHHVSSFLYEKLFRVSYHGTKDSVLELEQDVLVPLWAVPNDVNDPMYIESFGRTFFPKEFSWFFYSQYVLLEEADLEQNMDILLACFLTRSVPLLIKGEHACPILDESMRSRILAFATKKETCDFLNSLLPSDYDHHVSLVEANYEWATQRVTEWSALYKGKDKTLSQDAFSICQRKNFNRLYQTPEKAFL